MIATADFDSPWKEALEHYLPQCLALLLPEAHGEIDWSRGFHFLDSELQQVTPDATLGRRVVDKLVRVWRLDGGEAWVLMHLEIQNQRESDFARRKFGYYHRLLAQFDRPVASVAILGDDSVTWRPDAYEASLWGCSVACRFPVIKLLDYWERWDELERIDNPFAGVVMAHLRALETRDDAQRRGRAKPALTRWLFHKRYSREEILALLRFIDWLLRLPRDLELEYRQAVHAYEEAHHMPYVTSFEEYGIEIGIERGMERGRREGLLVGLEQIFELKFGEAGQRVFDEEVRQIEDVKALDTIAARLRTATTLEELRPLVRVSAK